MTKQLNDFILDEQFLEAMMEAIPGVFYVVNEELQFVIWNKNLETITGYSSNEMKYIHPLDFFLDNDKNLLANKIAECFQTGNANVEANLLLKNNSTIPYYFNAVSKIIDSKHYLVGLGIDISEKIDSENKIRLNDIRNRISQRHAKIGTWDWNIQTNELYWSEQIGPLIGYENKEIETTYDNFIAAVHPERS